MLLSLPHLPHLTPAAAAAAAAAIIIPITALARYGAALITIVIAPRILLATPHYFTPAATLPPLAPYHRLLLSHRLCYLECPSSPSRLGQLWWPTRSTKIPSLTTQAYINVGAHQLMPAEQNYTSIPIVHVGVVKLLKTRMQRKR